MPNQPGAVGITRQPEVRQHRVRLEVLCVFKGFNGIGDFHHPEALCLEQRFVHFARVPIVLDDEDDRWLVTAFCTSVEMGHLTAPGATMETLASGKHATMRRTQ